MPYDLLIKNGTVIDGTGKPRRHADVAVAQDKIAEIGKITGGARTVIDASDCIVAPGFIDPHTHYDAQVCWDPAMTPSSWHGVTTVVVGNCGVGIAPCRPDAHEVAMRDLVGVEGIDYDVLRKGIGWEWETFPEYLDAAARRGSALNLAFLATLSPFRHYVMGDAATERSATPEETAAVKALLKEAMSAGAFGFSTTIVLLHLGYQGRPLACRNASTDELRAYCNVLRECGKGGIEIALTNKVSMVSDEEYDLLEMLLTESGRPVTFIGLKQREDLPNACRELLLKVDPLIRRGAVPQTTAQYQPRELTLRTPFLFGRFASWAPVFNKSAEEQASIFRAPAFRTAFRTELQTLKNFNYDWHKISVNEVSSPSLRDLEGCTIAKIAGERGSDCVDTFLDISLTDNLETNFSFQGGKLDEQGIADILRDPRILIGMSDAGAHLDMMCEAGYCTQVLGHWVRDKNALSLEQAVQKMTSHPADVFGIKDRGRLIEGLSADLVVFDPTTVGSGSRREKRNDLPGGGKRFVMPSNGINWTVVNGELIYEKGQMTGLMPGQVLRS